MIIDSFTLTSTMVIASVIGILIYLIASVRRLSKQIESGQSQGLQGIQESLFLQMKDNRDQVAAINLTIEKRLSEGFEKTNTTFTDVVQRLAMIDSAQKKITELSGNIMSLQDILGDRKARGAFGEVQLTALLRNMLPESSFNLQHTLSNGKRPDCFLTLPDPTGNIAIDAKFPLETYHKMLMKNLTEAELKKTQTQFRIDIRHHIDEISSKYILPGETSDGAMMFIPAESVFAEIHSNFPDLVELAHRARVWMVSPTTMMAVLTTARAVLKDEATRQQIHIVQEHLILLAKDFERFEKRMSQLSKHIEQAHEDANDVHTSAKKITQRFMKIEQIDLEEKEVEEEVA